MSEDPRLRKLLWNTAGSAVFRMIPHNVYGLRRAVLRAFGADIHARALVRRTARIERPWLLTMGDSAIIGDSAWLTGRGRITLGDRCTVSQLVQLATTQLLRDPSSARVCEDTADIVIGDDAWVAADTLVLPGSRVEREALVGARSLVNGVMEAGMISAGQPAVARRERGLRKASSAAAGAAA